ncbi:hypothetical protein [Romboutsia sp.]|uniref:hypothetical protein n=1 Tax=Romboutsia sp. TaxID=1965302 RepID=UPI003F667400
MIDVPHLPDTGASWYYWKLPEKNFISQLTAWLLYGAHQLTINCRKAPFFRCGDERQGLKLS